MALKPINIVREHFAHKIFAAFTLFIFFISIAFAAVFIQHESDALVESLKADGRVLSKIIAHNARLGIFSENKEIVTDTVEGFFRHEAITEISAFTAEGNLLVSLNSPGTPKPNVHACGIDNPEDLLASSEPVCCEKKDWIVFFMPVLPSENLWNKTADASDILHEMGSFKTARLIGFISVSLDKTSFADRKRTLIIKSGVIGFLFWISGTLFIFLVVKKMTYPLRELTRAVKRLGNEKEVPSISVSSTDEVGKLAAAFNSLTEKLAKREKEKNLLEEQLRHAQKIEAVGTLAGGIAHDFNNILTIMMGYAELSLHGNPDANRLQTNMNEILGAGERARDLINQILTFSRQGEQQRKPIRLRPIVKEVIKMLRASLPTTIEIRHRIDGARATVMSDPTQIHQVLMNLCTNAGHAMRQNGGTLTIELTDIEMTSETTARQLGMKAGLFQRLTVSDTGEGMPPEIKNRIFEPFYTTKGPGQGTGMGLAVLHGIVKSHGGAIQVDSEPGSGTTFHVFLPALLHQVKDMPTDNRPLPLGHEHILFVDDEEALAMMGKQLLEGLGYEVTIRTSSIEALAAFRSTPNRYDLLITDMTMPNMTGDKLTREILKIRPNMPVILCTGFSELITEQSALSIGIQKYLMKPIIRRNIAEAVREVLDEGRNDRPDTNRATA